MKKVGVFIILTIVICLNVNNCSTKKIKKAYSEGRKSSYKTGYAKIETVYEKKIKDQQKFYEKKITVALQEGFDKGKKDRQQEVEDNIQRTTAEKESKGKWNDVLFDVKN